MKGGQSLFPLFRLGPHGLPKELFKREKNHLSITGQGISMEAATTIGTVPAMLRAGMKGKHSLNIAITFTRLDRGGKLRRLVSAYVVAVLLLTGFAEFIPVTGVSEEINDIEMGDNKKFSITKVNEPVITQSDTSLKAYWDFNELGGNKLYDQSKNGNDGAISGATWASGIMGGALRFDGIDDYVNCGNSQSLNFQKTTIEAWVNPSGWGENNYGRIVDKTGYFPNQHGYVFYLTNSQYDINQGTEKSFVFILQEDGQDGVRLAAPRNTISLNTWQHVAVSYDGSSMKLYHNGYLVASQTFFSAGIPQSSNPLFIGNNMDGNRTFNGVIDELRIYDRILTETEIQKSYSNTKNSRDLVIKSSDITYSISTPLPGNEIIISAKVTNIGTLSTNSFNVRFYDHLASGDNIQIGATKRLSGLAAGGSSTISSDSWIVPGGHHSVYVVVDTDNEVVEYNEDNNAAQRPLISSGAPVLLSLKPDYEGIFISGLHANNKFRATFSENPLDPVTKMKFEVMGTSGIQIVYDDYPADGFSADFDMGTLPVGYNDFKATAYSASGMASNSVTVSQYILNKPDWFENLYDLIGFSVIILPNKVIEYKCEWEAPDPKIKGEFNIGSVPVVGGKWEFDAGVKVELAVRTDGTAEISVGGGSKLKLGDAGGGEIGVTGTGYIDYKKTVNEFELNLNKVIIKIDGSLTIPVQKWPCKVLGFGVDVGVNILPEIKIEATFKSGMDNQIIPGVDLGFLDSEGTIGIGIQAYAKAGVGVGDLEVSLTGTPSITVGFPEPYLRELAFKLVLSAALKSFWGTIASYEYTWGWKTDLTSTNSVTMTGYTPLKRDWGEMNTLLYYDGDIIRPEDTLADDIIEEFVFPLAKPSIKVDDAGNAMLVWVHDDTSRPMPQGFDIYWSYKAHNSNDWTTPEAIIADTYPDFEPKLEFLPNGDAIAVWQRFMKSDLKEVVNPDDELNDVELMYSIWNRTFNNWSIPTRLTTNLKYDYLHVLDKSAEGNCMLTWVQRKVKPSYGDGVKEYTSRLPIGIHSNSEFTEENGVANWDTGDGSIENPWVIEGWEIDGTGGYCVYIGNTTEHFVIRDCHLHSAGSGAYNYPYFGESAIVLNNVSNGAVEGNLVLNNIIGIYLYDSENNTVEGNNASLNPNWAGIFLDYSSNNTVSDNIARENWCGIFLSRSSNNTIEGNNASANTAFAWNDSGIYLEYSDNNEVIANDLYDNYCGVYMTGSNGNLIYRNALVGNIDFNGYDDTGGNLWNTTYPIGGNHWSDYSGIDSDSDGIGDTPYVNGLGDVQDNYPLMYADDGDRVFTSTFTSNKWDIPTVVVPASSISANIATGYYSQDNLIFWVQDSDNQQRTKTDRDIFYSISDGNGWATHRLTNNSASESYITAASLDDSTILAWAESNITRLSAQNYTVYKSEGTEELNWGYYLNTPPPVDTMELYVLFENGTWFALTPDYDYSIDNEVGYVNMTEFGLPPPNATFHAWYDYEAFILNVSGEECYVSTGNETGSWGFNTRCQNIINGTYMLMETANETQILINGIDYLVDSYNGYINMTGLGTPPENARFLAWYQYAGYANVGSTLFVAEYESGIWTEPIPISYGQSISELQMKATSNGSIVLVWIGSSEYNQTIWYSVRDYLSGAWSEPTILDTGERTVSSVSMSISPDSCIYIGYVKGDVISSETGSELFGEDLYATIYDVNGDFATINISASDINPSPGDIIDINVTIKNIGTVKVPDSTGCLFDQTSGTVVSNISVPSLLSGEEYDASIPWLVPFDSMTHKLIFIADASNEVTELIESNNNASIYIVLPDITVSSPSIKYEDGAGILFDISNIGGANCQNFTLEVYDGNPNNNGTLIEAKEIQNLLKNETRSLITDWTPRVGGHSIYILPISGEIPDLNCSNNIGIGQISFFMQVEANVTINDLHPIPHETVGFSVEVINTGLVDGNASIVLYKGDPSINGSIEIANGTIFSMANSTDRIHLNWIAELGINEIHAKIIPEHNLSTVLSLFVGNITVTDSPDLTFDNSFILFDKLYYSEKESANITLKIVNDGYSDVFGSTVSMYRYVEGNYILLSTLLIDDLYMLTNKTMTFTISNLTWGEYDILFIVDSNDMFIESDELNNNFTYSFYVNQKPTLNLDGIVFNEDEQLQIFLPDYTLDDGPIEDISYNLTHNSDTLNITVEIIDDMLHFTPVPDWFGIITIHIEVCDAYTMVNYTYLVEVSPVNDLPYLVKSIDDFNMVVNSVDSTTVNLNNHFEDVDSVLAFAYSGNQYIAVDIQANGSVIFTPATNWTGNETITFTASDGEYDVSDSLLLSVYDPYKPRHSNESPLNTTSDITPTIYVLVRDESEIVQSTIKLYMQGFQVAHQLSPIPGGYNVSYTHESGFSDGDKVTCRILASDIYGNTLDYYWQFTVNTSVEFQLDLHQGWNLISIPMVQNDTAVEAVLSSIAGQWGVAKYYDGTTKTWKTYRVGSSVNTFWDIDHTMGFWLRANTACVLSASGSQPVTTNISLKAGWNLVSYPTATSGITVNDALSGVPFDRVEKFDIISPYITQMNEMEYMVPGQGYWIRVTSDCVWTIDW